MDFRYKNSSNKSEVKLRYYMMKVIGNFYINNDTFKKLKPIFKEIIENDFKNLNNECLSIKKVGHCCLSTCENATYCYARHFIDDFINVFEEV